MLKEENDSIFPSLSVGHVCAHNGNNKYGVEYVERRE
jgi:hypothetical protein